MTSDRSYPRPDAWTEVLDPWRCTAVLRVNDHGYRCQRYQRHDDAHAHAERVSVRPWRSHAHRWDDGGRRWVDEPIRRLRDWCCMFAA